MALWKQSLYTWSIFVGVYFKVLPLWSYGLCETMVPLLERFLELIFKLCNRVLLDIIDTCKSFSFKEFSILAIAKILSGLSLINKMDGSFL